MIHFLLFAIIFLDTCQCAIIESDMSTFDSEIFRISSGWTNGGTFDCWWNDTMVTFPGEYMQLSVDNTDCPCNGRNYSAAEVYTNEKLGYGYFGAIIKIPKDASGLMSGSIFTYDSSKDEIDIEFTGKDGGTSFEINWYKLGDCTGHVQTVDLDFDATDDFHEYGFVWKSDEIIWYVDGKEVVRVNEDIPTNNMNLMFNIWPGSQSSSGMVSWLGPLDYDGPYNYQVKHVRYYPGVESYPGDDEPEEDRGMGILCSFLIMFLAFLI